MSYDTRDQSAEDADPVLLFKFVQGATTYRCALATSAVHLSEDGTDWAPAVIVPSEFGHSNDVGKDELRIELAADCPLAVTFSGGTPDVITTVTVFRTFLAPEETPVTYWKGRVVNTGMEPGKVVLNCDPIFTQLKRPGLRALYTKMCRHVLFGRGCNLDADDYKTRITVYAASGPVVSLPYGNITPDGYWDGGMLTAPDGTSRMIVKHQGGKLTLIRPVASLNAFLAAHPQTGATVSLYRGCDHSWQMCKSRFNNGGNYGGDPNFAQKNPFTTQVSFV